MNPVSNTACHCCGVRMDAARRQRPLCNGVGADRLLQNYAMHCFECDQAKT